LRRHQGWIAIAPSVLVSFGCSCLRRNLGLSRRQKNTISGTDQRQRAMENPE
jgi:hypothetical protein